MTGSKPDDRNAAIDTIMRRARVIPVLRIDELEHAVPLGKTLVKGGLTVLEITLRTPVALDAIRAMRDAIPEATVGAGTILGRETVRQAEEAGAQFLVSPGSSPGVLDAFSDTELPSLPGVSSATEAMTVLERGISHMKFFPAEASGGARALMMIGGPLPGLRFCPTGGVNAGNAKNYLALDNVLCVGGSWMAPGDLMRGGKWDGIETLAREAAAS